ncbi:hypothetical protein HPB47_013998 [Ixodes persulcatus]|uniref:Uncharacterized protein n=1 Tax=Ixodes persulcatus TaxID=34615 RepID=A0AC60QZK3_IXOPE|nr:hypothetical protein HPB47_013998 [Ixodes persulcatus]
MASQSRDGNNAGCSTPNTVPNRSNSSQMTHLAIHALKKLIDITKAAVRRRVERIWASRGDRSLNANKADEFHLRFLRFDRLDPKRAFRTLKLYYVNRHKERDLFRNLLPSQLGHVFLRNLMVLLPEGDPSGRLVLVLRPGSWNPSQVPFLDVARALLLCFEYAMRRSSAQLRGLCMIFDMDGWSYDHMTNVPASRIKALSGVLAGYPIKNRRWDIVEQSYIFNVFFKMFTPFLDAMALPKCTAVCEENLEEMGGNAALANEFQLPFSDLTPTEREMVVRTQNSGLALYEGAIDLPPAPRSPPQSDSG